MLSNIDAPGRWRNHLGLSGDKYERLRERCPECAAPHFNDGTFLQVYDCDTCTNIAMAHNVTVAATALGLSLAEAIDNCYSLSPAEAAVLTGGRG